MCVCVCVCLCVGVCMHNVFYYASCVYFEYNTNICIQLEIIPNLEEFIIMYLISSLDF